jgi:protein TonB
VNNDAFASGALFARTAAGNAELSRPASSLSVPQRKLLLLIQQGSEYSTLMDSGPASDRDRRRRDLLRLIELRLVSEVDANGVPLPVMAQPQSSDSGDPLSRFGGATLGMAPLPAPNARRTPPTGATSEPFAAAPRAGDAPGRRGPTVAIVAIVGAAIVGGASWWVTHVGSDAPVVGNVAQSAPPPDNRAPKQAPTRVAAAAAPAIPASVQPPMLPAAATPPAPVAPTPALERGLKLMPNATPNPVTAARSAGEEASMKPQQLVAPKGPFTDSRAADKTDRTPAKDATPATTTAPASASLPAAQPANVPARSESAPATAVARIEPAASSTAPANSTVLVNSTAAANFAPAVDAPRPAARPPVPVAAIAAIAQQPAPASTAPTVASAAPTAAPAAAVPKILSRVNPDFPREAAIAGYTTGTIKARMRVAADGTVTGVEIVQANPERVFDRAVTRALSQWKFEPTGAARTVDHEVEFR